jgi:hypothetical protein
MGKENNKIMKTNEERNVRKIEYLMIYNGITLYGLMKGRIYFLSLVREGQ